MFYLRSFDLTKWLSNKGSVDTISCDAPFVEWHVGITIVPCNGTSMKEEFFFLLLAIDNFIRTML